MADSTTDRNISSLVFNFTCDFSILSLRRIVITLTEMNIQDLKISSTKKSVLSGLIQSVKIRTPARKNGTHKLFRFHQIAASTMGM